MTPSLSSWRDYVALVQHVRWSERITAMADRTGWRLGGPAGVVMVAVFATAGYSDGSAWHSPSVPQALLIVSGAVALLFRLRYPLAVTVLTLLCGVAFPLLTPHTVIFNAPCVVAFFTLAILGDRRRTWVVAAAGIVGLTVSSALWLPGHLLNIRNLLPANYITIAVFVGETVRNRGAALLHAQERLEQVEHAREQQARRRVLEERIRIARDLHDVVAHHITLVNAQAGVAHHLLHSHPEKAYQALADIKATSSTALEELRATVGLLRQDNDPPQTAQPLPRFASLDELLISFRATGLDVRLDRQGQIRPLNASADLAAYRIVQEALTNASKHSTHPCVDIGLTYTASALHLAVTNPARAGHHGPGTGHGLIGMRERSEAAGGKFRAEMTANGIFGVEVTLPLPPEGNVRQ